MFSKNETLKLKGIAILLLLFHHMFYNAERVTNSGIKFIFFEYETIQQIAVAARICVWIFVFLSAYGLTCSYLNRKQTTKIRFIINHWISLMKGYWIVYAAVFVMCWIAKGNTMQIYENNIIYIFLDFMGWSDFFGSPMLSGVWWYMCFAQLLIIAIPFVNALCEKLGASSFLITFFALQYLPDGIKSPYGGRYSNYFLVVVLAVLCARNGIFDKIALKDKSKRYKILYFVLELSAILMMLKFKLVFGPIDKWQMNSFVSAVIAFCICDLVSKYCGNKWLSSGLMLLGKHSANMFMAHACFYTWYPKYIYWSGNAAVSYLTLLAVSIVFSAIIEWIKKLSVRTRYFAGRQK